MPSVPDYTIAGLIHEGYETVLYRGTRDADRARVALKLPRDPHPSPQILARLRHEHAIASELRLEGVVATYGLVKIGHSLALVMEDFGGRPLNDVVREGRVDLEASLRVAIGLARALSAVHKRGVLHRDIKPHNILYCADAGVVKLTDFGIAARAAEPREGAGPRQLAGTLAYISPEQTGRMGLPVDRRSDLYSLGVTLYELWSGAPPFEATDPAEIVHSHIARVPAPLVDRAPSVPEQLSAVVMKLLAKSPEDRYQSGAGLAADLEECLSQWKEKGRIDPFPLGRHDAALLRLPDGLHGRAAELTDLLAACDRVISRAEGSTEAIFIVGGAGAGKSSLMAEAQRAIAEKGGVVGAARFERLEQGAPYAAVARALSELVRRMLSEPAEALARFRDRIRLAAGPNGQILVDLVPELALILGPQPAPQPLGPVESRNRFTLLIQSFLRAFERPVALFLDDLQWADGPSLSLVRILLTAPERPRLLVVVAYRDEDAPPDILADLRAQGVNVGEIVLAPLDRRAVRDLLLRTLGCDAEAAGALADLLHAKTRGNPFFLCQILRSIQIEGLLAQDPATRRWTWDARGIEALAVDDDVAEVVATKITHFSPRTREALEIAACVGLEFDLEALASAHGVAPEGAAADLVEALDEGLVVSASSERGEVDEAACVAARYRFVHDRVRQAAYARVDAERRRALHLRIGRLLLARAATAPSDAQIFDVVSHKNLAVTLIDDSAERMDLARMNLMAGRQAKVRAAYQPASSYLQAGIALLCSSAWEDAYDLAFALHIEQAECDALVGRVEDAEARLDVLAAHARTRADRARAFEHRINLYTQLGRFKDALAVARAALAELGIVLPQGAERVMAMLAEVSREVQDLLRGRSVKELMDAPPLTDPDVRAAIRLLIAVMASAYLEEPPLYPLVATVRIALSQKHGRSEMDAYGYSTHAFLLAVMGRVEEARPFWELSAELNEREGTLDLKCKTNNVLATSGHLFLPLRGVLAYTSRSFDQGLLVGELTFASYAANTAIIVRFAAGDPLDVVLAEAERYLAFTRRSKELMSTLVQVIAERLAACLLGRTRDAQSLSDDGFDEAAFAREIAEINIPFVRCWYHAAKLALAVFAGDPHAALAEADAAAPFCAAAVGNQFVLDIPFYAGLALAAVHGDAAPAERASIEEKLAARCADLARFADLNPASYGARSLLLRAESARVSGDEASARELYDQAIAAARAAEMIHIEALASEICARLYLARAQDKIAAVYLKDAHHAYELWGAARKVAALAARFPDALVPAVPRERSTTTSTTSTTGGTGSGLDTLALIRAAQAIAGEIVLDTLVERLLRAAVESAGARRGVLLLARGDDLRVVARLAVDPDRLEVGLSIPAAESGDIAMSIVQLVARIGSAVVVGDAGRDIRFAADPYLGVARARSILCLAMKHRSQLSGVLYLENDAVREAFTPDRLDLCAVLSAQAAIAVENAVLVDELQRRTEDLRDANAGLVRELAERAALEQELLRVQTPIIPITDRVMVMPLVGNIDAARAHQILETALRGVQSNRASAVILDITGVPQIGPEIAAILARTAHALRLLGAQAIITGIRPPVAIALIELGVDLASVVTRGTLQAGVAYAMGGARALG